MWVSAIGVNLDYVGEIFDLPKTIYSDLSESNLSSGQDYLDESRNTRYCLLVVRFTHIISSERSISVYNLLESRKYESVD